MQLTKFYGGVRMFDINKLNKDDDLWSEIDDDKNYFKLLPLKPDYHIY